MYLVLAAQAETHTAAEKVRCLSQSQHIAGARYRITSIIVSQLFPSSFLSRNPCPQGAYGLPEETDT